MIKASKHRRSGRARSCRGYAKRVLMLESVLEGAYRSRGGLRYQTPIEATFRTTGDHS
jgi:hypothetical protein